MRPGAFDLSLAFWLSSLAVKSSEAAVTKPSNVSRLIMVIPLFGLVLGGFLDIRILGE